MLKHADNPYLFEQEKIMLRWKLISTLGSKKNIFCCKRIIVLLPIYLLLVTALILGFYNIIGKKTLPRERENLVLYAFSDTNAEYINNLRFFVKEAIENDFNSDYHIIVQGGSKDLDLPALPSHAKYVYHKNECYDWGAFGWLLEKVIEKRRYKYYFFINCSVKGPYLPPYAKGRIPWTAPFIVQLGRNGAKLVGPTINCEGSPLTRDWQGPWRANPHVQSYAIATDEEGLAILLATDQVFKCHMSRMGTIYYSELGSSLAILKAGHNIGSFMAKYDGVDWRQPNVWNCNQRVSPVSDHYDGYSLDPYEVMFIKVKHGLDNMARAHALKYDEWRDKRERSPQNVSGNAYSETDTVMRRLLMVEAFGHSCFDHRFYRMHNRDLHILHREELLWRHFMLAGQFENRPFRMACTMRSVVNRVFPDYTQQCGGRAGWIPQHAESSLNRA